MRPIHAYGLEPQGRTRAAKSRSGVWIALGALFLVLTIAAIVLGTPVGVALGVRRAPLGAVELRTQPNAPARVRLDDVYRGVAPLRMEGVRVGPRRLSIEADGYLPVAKEVDVQPGATALIEVALVPDRPRVAPTALTAPPAPDPNAPNSTPSQAPALPAGVTGPAPGAPAQPEASATPSGERDTHSSRRPRSRHREPDAPASSTPATATAAAAPDSPGNLVINSVPWAYVWVDGQDTRRTTPMMGFPLSPGPHEVQLRTAMGQVHTERVTISAGQTTRIVRRF